MAFNNGFGISALHLIVKNVEFSIIQGPIIDPYVKRGSRSNVRAAIDLCINSRMVDLGQIHLDKESTSQKGREEAINEIGGPDGGIEMNGSRIPHKKERWLPYTNVHRSRPAATFRHFTHAIFHYIIIDTLCELLWHFGQETIANPNGIPNAIPTFLDNNPFVILPNTSNPIPVPKFVVEQLIKLFLAAGIWQGITWGYHSIAFVAVGSGIWEVESWEVDIFDAPWKTDSLLDMWGKRWHQIFRVRLFLI